MSPQHKIYQEIFPLISQNISFFGDRMSSSEEFLREALEHLREDEEILALIIFTRRKSLWDVGVGAHILTHEDLENNIKIVYGEETYEDLHNLLMFMTHIVIEVLSGLIRKDPETVYSLRTFVDQIRDYIKILKMLTKEDTEED
jgi:hypothetical protein